MSRLSYSKKIQKHRFSRMSWGNFFLALSELFMVFGWLVIYIFQTISIFSFIQVILISLFFCPTYNFAVKFIGAIILISSQGTKNNVGLTAQNSMSLNRKPGAYTDSVKGESSNNPFWPGILKNNQITLGQLNDK